ncbi:MAG: hypothetical protein M1820_005385 [Bogoriella megaspora]|nr:MAG: hypothetical protein M1820_005385 [Bogoriella megaspora]
MIGTNLQVGLLKAALLVSLASYTQSFPLTGNNFGVPGDNITYDYIVVGGGNAGLTLATRLIQQTSGSVAVVEAGSFYEISNGNISQVPATNVYFDGSASDDWQPMVDWGYQTTPQVGRNGESIHYARGRTLGGSSARNFMVYQRGTEGSYQNWADAVGDDSWSWTNFLPFFQKSVTFTPPDMNLRMANSTPSFNADVASANSGSMPLSVTYSHYAQAFATWAVEGFRAIGLPVIDGFLSGKLLGQSYATFTINATTMNRDSSETSFLRVGMAESTNLKVYPSTLATKVLFDQSKKATGVAVNTGGRDYILSANQEVILSAGSIGSPQLLLVSGVGPASDLNALNIPVVADRPGVGQGLQDHVFYDIAYKVNAPTLTTLQGDAGFAAEHSELYTGSAAGMWTNPGADVFAWEKIPNSYRTQWSNETQTALAAYPSDWPEAEYISISTLLGDMKQSRAPPKEPGNYASLAVVLVAPRSRGNISITSADVNVHPQINPNFLTEQSDIDILIAGFKRIRGFFETDALKNITVGDEFFPGKNVTSDAQIESFIRQNFNTIWHATSTCSMGKTDDPKAVVDSHGSVIGVQGLRVVDASIFPLLPPGHPMSTVYAVAEKLACDISGNC